MSDLILIHGLKFSGKSTLADHLVEKHGYVRVKMATPLKNMVRSLLRDAGVAEDLIERHVEGDLKEAPIAELGGVTARALMMTLGEEWRNMHGHMLWANIGAAKVAQIIRSGGRAVIDDIRYRFEIERMAEFSPFRTVITRGNLHFEPYGEDRHPGERPIPVSEFDFHFRNDSDDKSDLWSVAEFVLEALDGLRRARTEFRDRLSAVQSMQDFPPPAAPAITEADILAQA